MAVLTDGHAHLISVAEELGAAALREVLSAYREAWDASLAAGLPAPLLVDIGTGPEDLVPRQDAIRGAGQSEKDSGRPGVAGLADALGLAEALPFLRMTAGVWPSAEAVAVPNRALRELEAAISAHEASGGRVAAIGEGGLDYRHMNGSREAQIELFEGQIGIARRLGLPLVVHSREAFEDTRDILAAAGLEEPVVIHCFGYGPDEARAFLSLGCHVSFAGNLTYKRADALREACALVPAYRLLVETDAPYMNPEPRRGRPCTPLDVERTYAVASALRRIGPAELAEVVSRNARIIFG
jgi:TatD DNase family protein